MLRRLSILLMTLGGVGVWGTIPASANTGWVIQPTPNPSGATTSLLNGVSCTSASACTAVGAYTSASGYRALAERWNGSSWKIQPTPSPADTEDSLLLLGVSCTSATSCTAVGEHLTSSGSLPLAERWNGTSWEIQPTSVPTGTTSAELLGVNCTSATACTAVGRFDNDGRGLTLAERWNGSSWKVQSTPSPSPQINLLEGIACTTATNCIAVGTYETSFDTDLPLAERWNGSSWKIQQTPSPADTEAAGLHSVSCTSASACTAVGTISTAIRVGALAERWNGTAWKIESVPNPAGQTGSLYGVKCSSGTRCTAIGNSQSSSIDTTLAETWNGSSWNIQRTPPPPGGSGNFTAVSCISATRCTAVGLWFDATGVHTLAERRP